jgi:serine/threonine-protein kinase RsbW
MLDDQRPIIRLSIPNRFDCLGMLGCSVRAISMEYGLSQEIACHMELAVIEAVTNVIRHNPNLPTASITFVDISSDAQGLEYQITDQGMPIPAEVLANARGQVFEFDPDDLDGIPECGMGLSLIKSVADQLDYQANQQYNIMTIKRFRE